MFPVEQRYCRRSSPSIPMRYKPAALLLREDTPLFTPLCEFSRQRWWVNNFIEQASESARKEAKSDVIATSRPGGGPDTEITGSPPYFVRSFPQRVESARQRLGVCVVTDEQQQQRVNQA